MKHKITLIKHDKGWFARHSDPACMELFGTDTLPTAYTVLMPAETVLEEIARLNPDIEVTLR